MAVIDVTSEAAVKRFKSCISANSLPQDNCIRIATARIKSADEEIYKSGINGGGS